MYNVYNIIIHNNMYKTHRTLQCRVITLMHTNLKKK